VVNPTSETKHVMLCVIGATTSIRLPENLKLELDTVSGQLHRGKNWIITEALRIYLKSLRNPSWEIEAKRQSLLVSQEERLDIFLEDNADSQGWV
jgi:predicted DNA-binding protein